MQTQRVETGSDAKASVAREIAAALRSEKRKRREEALRHYQNAVQVAGRDSAAFAEAVRQIARACVRSPRDADLQHLLGSAYLFVQDYRNAEAPLRKFADLMPRNATAHRLLGDCLMRGGKTAEAIAAHRKAVAIAPHDRDTSLRLAGLLVYAGEKAEARALYQRVIDGGGRDPLAYSGLIEVTDYSETGPEPPEYSAAISLAEKNELPPALRRMLYFSAAKIDRARKRRDLEFAHYVSAKRHFPYRFDLAYFSELVGALKEAITPEFYSERAAYSDVSSRPIFIFGMPRSGTTLAEQILAAHPSVGAGGEMTFFSETVRRLGLGPRRTENSVPLERIAERIGSLDLSFATGLGARYIEQIEWRGGGKDRVTDKMPGNFLNLWLIALVFRDARYIHCIRDPLATCFSCFTTDLSDAHAYTSDLSTLGRYYRIYEDMMRHWEKVLPIRITANRYEDLVSEPEDSVQRLVDMAGLPWDPACLSFHHSERLAQTASYAAVREPIHPRNLEKWRAYDEYLGPLKEALGIARDSPALAPG